MRISVFGEFQNEKVEQFYLERLRRLTIEQRWRIVAEMREVAINMVRAEVRTLHPDWGETKVRLEATRRIMEAHGTIFRADVRPATGA
ncbi:MAG TPA: hypothetical protein VJL59_11875 [Anaerolineales bacterium]|nr:hypothetical protein [Anaerolineales bacterium]